MATYPNVPNVPGVPPILRSPVLPAVQRVIATGAALFLLFGKRRPVWGLFNKSGQSVITADTVTAFDFRQGYSISNYPVEQGSFESYNKVDSPFMVKLRFVAGGDDSNRQNLLNSVARVAKSLELFDAVTPERVYLDVNVTDYDYRRRANNGLGLLEIDVFCLEVRVRAQARFTNTKSPASAAVVDGGTVQPTPATPRQSALSSLVQ